MKIGQFKLTLSGDKERGRLENVKKFVFYLTTLSNLDYIALNGTVISER
jgi:hypothetical protein